MNRQVTEKLKEKLPQEERVKLKALLVSSDDVNICIGFQIMRGLELTPFECLLFTIWERFFYMRKISFKSFNKMLRVYYWEDVLTVEIGRDCPYNGPLRDFKKSEKEINQVFNEILTE